MRPEAVSEAAGHVAGLLAARLRLVLAVPTSSEKLDSLDPFAAGWPSPGSVVCNDATPFCLLACSHWASASLGTRVLPLIKRMQTSQPSCAAVRHMGWKPLAAWEFWQRLLRYEDLAGVGTDRPRSKTCSGEGVSTGPEAEMDDRMYKWRFAPRITCRGRSKVGMWLSFPTAAPRSDFQGDCISDFTTVNRRPTAARASTSKSASARSAWSVPEGSSWGWCRPPRLSKRRGRPAWTW